MRIRLVIVLVIAACGVAAVSAEELHPSPDQWNLTSYLKGTPEQIRHILYKDIIRMDRSIRDSERGIEEAKSQLAKDTAESLEKCRERPDYISAKTERDAAARELVAARNGGSTEDRIRASSRFNRAKAITDRLEAEALSGNANIQADQKQLSTDTSRLADQQKSLSDAIEWKDHLLAAGANSLKLVWPLDRGASGFLGTVKVEEADGDQLIVEYEAFEALGQVDSGEGLVVRKGVVHPVKLLVTCPEARGAHRGSHLLLNRTFEVAAVRDGGEEARYLMRLAPADADKLWLALTAPVTDAELGSDK